MRLLNVHTLKVGQFFEDGIPEYAALSHTWGSEEASLQEWTQHSSPGESTKRGFLKVLSACELARRDGFQHLWVDTVCIDKTSSVEVTEAINSTFQWYRDAKVSYAYLEDMEHHPGSTLFDQLRTCRWFTRGWTVHELIAPKTVKFYDHIWSMVGTKSALVEEIANITSISEKVLRDSEEIMRQSVAQRMSWFARRRTSRKEDVAYCTLGIFDVNMLPMYGEGTKAFIRLQEAIIKETNDRTIFCWTWPVTIPQPTWIPCLAPHPAAFQNSGQYVPDRRAEWRDALGYSVNNNLGIKIQLRVAACTSESLNAILDVKCADDPSDHLVALPLVRATSRSTWGKSEPVWRAAHPAAPIRLPSTWGWTRRDLTLSRPGSDCFEGDPIPGKVSSLSKSVPHDKLSPFAALVLECIDLKEEELARLVRVNQQCAPLMFFKPTRSPRVWHRSVEVRTWNGDYLVYLAVWLCLDGKISWRAGLDALEPYAPISVIENQVASWSNKVEFRVSGQGVDGIGCLEFAEDGMELDLDQFRSSEGQIVRPASFSVYSPGRRALLG